MEKEKPRTLTKFRVALYLINVSLTLLRGILTYIDKEEFDHYNILDTVFGVLLLVDLTLSILANRDNSSFEYKLVTSIIVTVLLIPNSVMPFFAYYNSKKRDFQPVCVFLAILRIATLFAYFLCTVLDDEVY